MSTGVIVGCDKNQEWLLPFWWSHYSKENNYPVAFFDFGMTKQAADWCKTKGAYIKLLPKSMLKKNETLRTPWFQKPHACFHTPFPITCWLDLDCEVKGNLEPLFQMLGQHEMAMVKTPRSKLSPRWRYRELPSDMKYNSGVIVFRKNTNIITKWIKMGRRCITDDYAISLLIYREKLKIQELPPIFNWMANQGPNPNALIIHYILEMKLLIAISSLVKIDQV